MYDYLNHSSDVLQVIAAVLLSNVLENYGI